MTLENLPAANDPTNADFGAPTRSGTRGVDITIRKLSEGEIIERAREAYIASHRPWKFLARQIRRGRFDFRLHAATRALRDMHWPIEALFAEEEIATTALAIKATPLIGLLPEDHQAAVASAIMTALRVQRRR